MFDFNRYLISSFWDDVDKNWESSTNKIGQSAASERHLIEEDSCWIMGSHLA